MTLDCAQQLLVYQVENTKAELFQICAGRCHSACLLTTTADEEFLAGRRECTTVQGDACLIRPQELVLQAIPELCERIMRCSEEARIVVREVYGGDCLVVRLDLLCHLTGLNVPHKESAILVTSEHMTIEVTPCSTGGARVSLDNGNLDDWLWVLHRELLRNIEDVDAAILAKGGIREDEELSTAE